MENPIKKHRIFHLPRFMNPTSKIERFNILKITCILLNSIASKKTKKKNKTKKKKNKQTKKKKNKKKKKKKKKTGTVGKSKEAG